MTREEKGGNPAGPAPDWLRAPAVVLDPGPEYGPGTRAFQGIPSIAWVPEKRLCATWYGGPTPGEDHNNYVMAAVSDDLGTSWSGPGLVIDPDGPGPVRAFDPEIWLAPDGRLRLFWAQGLDEKLATRSGVWVITADDPAGEKPRWSEPRRICDGVMMCKPLVLSSGEWCLPVSLWHRRAGGSAALFASADRGRTWAHRGACDVPPESRSHDEHMVFEAGDGSLRMLVRTRYGIGASRSADRGRTWSALEPSRIPHPCSRFFIRRLASGRLLLVRHDPVDGAFADGVSSGTRSHLAAFLSEDDGATWPWRLMLDERAGVSYPDGDQDGEGTIHVIYDYQRRGAREILTAAFREEDVISGAGPGRAVRRALVNRASA